jgi:hypothetical protein
MSDLILDEHLDELIHLLKSVHAVSDLLASLRHPNLVEETQEYIGFLIGRLSSESLDCVRSIQSILNEVC